MNQKELKELIEFVIEKDIVDFELERGDVKIKIRRAGHASPPAALTQHFVPVAASPLPVLTQSPVAASAAPAQELAAAVPSEQFHAVRSPIVGTFYEAPSPGAPPFVKVGDHVEVGQILCIVEAMKLMNEIECDVAGEIVKKLASNGQPIEYGQELFLVRPKK